MKTPYRSDEGPSHEILDLPVGNYTAQNLMAMYPRLVGKNIVTQEDGTILLRNLTLAGGSLSLEGQVTTFLACELKPTKKSK